MFVRLVGNLPILPSSSRPVLIIMRNAGFSSVLLAVLLTVSGFAASIPVTSTGDNGPGSLRQAIAIAAAGDTINFTNFPVGVTISLTNGELLINKSLVVDGPGAALLTVERHSRRHNKLPYLQCSIRHGHHFRHHREQWTRKRWRGHQ